MKSFVVLVSALSIPFALACSGAPSSVGASTSAVSSGESCDHESDCTGFLPQSDEVCVDGTSQPAKWACEEHACTVHYCSYHGGVATRAPAAGACQAASDCSGFLPRSTESCADGSSQGAHWDCNAGACVIGYCDNNGGPATGGGSTSSSTCGSPADCTGFLPASVETCADGSSQGAQWDCNAGACVISYCDNNGGTATSGGSNACQLASDCSGFLPRSTESCADGSSQGAQWDCNAGACVISYCDNNGGTAN